MHPLFKFARPFVMGAPKVLSRLPNQIDQLNLKDQNLSSLENQVWKIPFPYQEHELSLSEHSRFVTLLNLGNGYAYGDGMGMPEWVMMDCALLPSIMSGWCIQGRHLPTLLRQSLNEYLKRHFTQRSPIRIDAESRIGLTFNPIDDDEWVGVSEFCALKTLTPNEIVGYSLYSLLKGGGGLTKSIGLRLHHILGARTQIGVTQWTHPKAICTHLKMGAMQILNPYILNHSRGGESFLYRLWIDPQECPLSDFNPNFLKVLKTKDHNDLLALFQEIQSQSVQAFLLPSHPPTLEEISVYVCPPISPYL